MKLFFQLSVHSRNRLFFPNGLIVEVVFNSIYQSLYICKSLQFCNKKIPLIAVE